MATSYDERCLRCKWFCADLNPPCGRTFEATIHIAPHGGTVNISTTPGLIPQQFEEQLTHMLGRIFENVVNAMEFWPGWKELSEIQASNSEKVECPGRDESKNEFLRLVKT